MTTRMHDNSAFSEHIVDLVLDYSKRRLLAEDIPIDRGSTERELQRLAGKTITAEGIGTARALGLFEHVLAPACVTTEHPRNLAFIPSAPTKAAAAFDVVVSASSIFGGSWKEASGVVHAENETLAWLAKEFGFPETAGGVFVQGGTVGNLSALVAAREKAQRKNPNFTGRWKIICSKEAHSSIKSACHVMGAEAVLVAGDKNGKLRGDAVREALTEHGEAVCAVVATGGATNFGIVDAINEVAALKSEFDFWLHVDGAYGLAAALTDIRRDKFAGLEHADSAIVDPHKWLFSPYDACALIYRDPEEGRRAHTQKAEYLDVLTETVEFNPSDYAIQLTRRARGLPTWFSLAVYGTDAYREAISHSIELADRAAAEIKQRKELELVREPELSVVVFKRRGWKQEDYDRWSDELLADEVGFVVPSSFNGEPVLRFALINPRTTFEDLLLILDRLK